jgi:hypothetical protein
MVMLMLALAGAASFFSKEGVLEPLQEDSLRPSLDLPIQEPPIPVEQATAIESPNLENNCSFSPCEKQHTLELFFTALAPNQIPLIPQLLHNFTTSQLSAKFMHRYGKAPDWRHKFMPAPVPKQRAMDMEKWGGGGAWGGAGHGDGEAGENNPTQRDEGTAEAQTLLFERQTKGNTKSP